MCKSKSRKAYLLQNELKRFKSDCGLIDFEPTVCYGSYLRDRF